MVVSPGEFARNDPFILLMDDRVDRPAGPLGGAHPHAGFETVTFVLEGSIQRPRRGIAARRRRALDDRRQRRDPQRGVVSSGKVRILQLWLTLPKAERWAEPRFERITRGAAPGAARAGRRDPAVQRPHGRLALADAEPRAGHARGHPARAGRDRRAGAARVVQRVRVRARGRGRAWGGRARLARARWAGSIGRAAAATACSASPAADAGARCCSTRASRPAIRS